MLLVFGDSGIGKTTLVRHFLDDLRQNEDVLTLEGRSYERESNLQPVPLMNMDFVVSCQLIRHRMPQIRFLYIGSHLCSTLLSDSPSPERPCASL